MIRLLLILCSLASAVTRTHQDLIDLVGRKGDITHLYDLYNRASWVTPVEFGGAPNDTIDDTRAIQAAYNSITVSIGGATGGGILFLPKGRWKVGKDSASLLFDKPFITIQGEGPTATEIYSADSGASLIKFMGDTAVGGVRNFNCGFRDLKIIQTGGTRWESLLHLLNVSEMGIENVWVETGTATRGMRVESSLNLNFWNCIFRGGVYAVDIFKKAGSSGETYPNNINIIGGGIKSATTWGLRYRNGEGLKLFGIDFSANGSADDTLHGGIFVDSCGQEVGQGYCATIDNGWFEANRGAVIRVGIHAFAPGGTLIRGCSGAAAAAQYGVYGSGNPGFARIENTSFIGAAVKDYYFADGFSVNLINSKGVNARLPNTAVAKPVPGTSYNKSTASFENNGVWDITDNSATPSFANAGGTVKVANTVATVWTQILDAADGNAFDIVSTNGNTTIQHNSSGTDKVTCPGAVDLLLSTTPTRIVRIAGHWYAK